MSETIAAILLAVGFCAGFLKLLFSIESPDREEAIKNLKFVIKELILRGYSAQKTLEIIHMYIDVKTI